jgi:uncharacterized membrane protein
VFDAPGWLVVLILTAQLHPSIDAGAAAANRPVQGKEPARFAMSPTSYHYFPLTAPFLLALALLLALAIAFIEVSALRYAYSRMGIDRRYLFALLVLSLLGSYVNIPVAELPAEYVHAQEVVTFFGMQYVVPLTERLPRTLIAVNLGGCLLPVLLSLYLIRKNRLYTSGILATIVVAAIAHVLARPIPGIGIAEPVFVPPLVAATVALFLSRANAGALAYIGGSRGTLIGADLLNLDKVQGLGAPIASIGGAGTFDGIFLSGVLGVLLASWLGGGRRSFSRTLPEPGTGGSTQTNSRTGGTG